MKTKTQTHSIKTIALLSSIALSSIFSLPAFANGESLDHSGQASKHTVLAVGHGLKTSAKVGSAVVAAPIVVAGGVSLAAGSVAVSVGDSIANSSQDVSVNKHKGPLVITDMVITADPAPNKLKKNRPNNTLNETTITTTEVKQTTIKNKR